MGPEGTLRDSCLVHEENSDLIVQDLLPRSGMYAACVHASFLRSEDMPTTLMSPLATRCLNYRQFVSQPQAQHEFSDSSWQCAIFVFETRAQHHEDTKTISRMLCDSDWIRIPRIAQCMC